MPYQKSSMHHDCNCNHSQPNRYQYKGYWIHIYLEADWEYNLILYTASVELPNDGGVVTGYSKESREEAEFAAEELIDSWN